MIALNVVEHIGDDGQAIANARKLLRPGGQLVILVPAYQLLFNRFDTELGHYRRDTRTSLNELLGGSGLEVSHSFHFNLAGTLGWFLARRLLRNKIPPASHVGLFNRLVPLFRALDWLTGRRLGLSVVSVGREPEARRLAAAA